MPDSHHEAMYLYVPGCLCCLGWESGTTTYPYLLVSGLLCGCSSVWFHEAGEQFSFRKRVCGVINKDIVYIAYIVC